MRTAFPGAATDPPLLTPSPLRQGGKNDVLDGEGPSRIEADLERSLIIIERRSFVRSCILASLTKTTGLVGIGVPSVHDYLACSANTDLQVVVLCAMGAKAPEVAAQIAQIKTSARAVPVVVMTDSEEAELILAVMEGGANGFIPADISLDVAAHALRLVIAGGQYFPVHALMAAQRAIEAAPQMEAGCKGMFTRRQVAVIDALRQGKANKIIAYELNMCESTVKVHIRNIMKKLKAKNRTQVAYLANELLRSPT